MYKIIASTYNTYTRNVSDDKNTTVILFMYSSNNILHLRVNLCLFSRASYTYIDIDVLFFILVYI